MKPTVGRDEIFADFLTNPATNATSAMEQTFNCITGSFSLEFCHKS